MRFWVTLISLYAISALAMATEVEHGKEIFQQKCTRCHKLPVTGTRTAEQWSLLVDVMQQTMANRGVTQLSEQEQRELLNYLASTEPTTHSKEETNLARETFVTRCALCHQLPEPTMLRPKQWQAILVTMQTRMQQAGIPELTQEQTALILQYLSEAASE
jgi:mono/diheme cytochrome c family protein